MLPDVLVDRVSELVDVSSGTFVRNKCDRFRLRTLSLLSVIKYDLGEISVFTIAGCQFAFGSFCAMTRSPLSSFGSDAVCWS